MKIRQHLLYPSILNILGILFSIFCYGQVNITSPDISSLGSYSLIPPNLFNGSVPINLSLYEMNYKGVKIPLTMNYNTRGLKPSEDVGTTGIGWSLQAGGAILRKRNGLSDELVYKNPFNNTQSLNYIDNCGILSVNTNNINENFLKKFSLYGMDNVSREYYENSWDGEPDEFIFNFNEYSGRFYITKPSPNGAIEIKVRPNGNYKLKAEIIKTNWVSFTAWHDWNNNNREGATDREYIYGIQITDEKGIKYIFGNDINALEFSTQKTYDDFAVLPAWEVYGCPNNQIIPYSINTWYLKEIQLPTSDKVLFNYTRGDLLFSQYVQANKARVAGSETYWSIWGVGKSSVSMDGFAAEDPSVSRTICITSPVYLQSIESPVEKIEFTFTDNKQTLFEDLRHDIKVDMNCLLGQFKSSDNSGPIRNNQKKLEKIKIDGVKFIKFNYTEQNNYRLQLASINVYNNDQTNNYNLYKFKYNPLKLPGFNSFQTDHWGYYNGRSYIYKVGLSYHLLKDYETIRNPDEAYLQAEMLTEIQYPTGGYLRLEYEPHRYSKVVDRFPFNVKDVTNNSLAGGLRIKKMTIAASDTETPETEEFYYINDYLSGGTISTGVLSGVPQYRNNGTLQDTYRYGGNIWTSKWGNIKSYFCSIHDNNFISLSQTNGSDVTYSQVTKKTKGGYIVYNYTNHENGYLDKAPSSVFSSFTSKFQNEKFTSMELYRGLLLNTSYYDDSKSLLKELNYQYTIDLNSFYQVPFLSRLPTVNDRLFARVSAGVYYIKPALLKQVREKEYSLGKELENTKTFKYYPDVYASFNKANDNYKEVQTDYQNSNGDIITQKLKYPMDYTGVAVYDEMIKRNILDPVIEQATIKNENSYYNKEELSKTQTNFSFWNNKTFIAPSEVKQSKWGNALESETIFNQYDQYGNVVEFTSKEGLTTTIVWGYKSAYPVAKIVGANLATVKSKITTDGLTEGLSASAINSLKTIPGAFVSTYTYKPLIGITSETDPNGRTAYYEYDSFGRLQHVKDDEQNIVKKYEYNYYDNAAKIFVNEEKSKEYVSSISTSCEDGRVAKPVKYIVEAGKYFSSISQDDADQKAMEDIAKNGQDYANKYGKCLFYNDYDENYYWPECPDGYEATSDVYYPVAEGTYSSDISQEDANMKMFEDFMANGQRYANEHCNCIRVFYSKPVAMGFLSKKCPEGIAIIEFQKGAFTSNLSQEDADKTAEAYLKTGGQWRADMGYFSKCIPNTKPFVSLDYEDTEDVWEWPCYHQEIQNVKIRFWADVNKTIPLRVKDVSVSLQTKESCSYNNFLDPYYFFKTVVCNDTEASSSYRSLNEDFCYYDTERAYCGAICWIIPSDKFTIIGGL